MLGSGDNALLRVDGRSWDLTGFVWIGLIGALWSLCPAGRSWDLTSFVWVGLIGTSANACWRKCVGKVTCWLWYMRLAWLLFTMH